MRPGRDPTQRFSGRADDYARHRPGYPPDLLCAIAREAALSESSAVADIGSGTGISTELLLGRGCTVFAVEPNEEMRARAERRLAARAGFVSVRGSAERTTLPDASVDLVAAGQAFHWFDRERARQEFRRILRPPGWVALFWNSRRADTPFLAAYEALLQRFAVDYREVNHERVGSAEIAAFLGGPPLERSFPNEQALDWDGLRGRLLSSSYAPPAGHPDHAPMLVELRRAFDAHAEGGRVRMLYDTRLYLGRQGGDGDR